MSKNPLLNAVAALVYIIVVSILMFYGSKNLGTPNSLTAPIAMLSLFTMSAAVMSYIFFFYPMQMFLDGKKKEAVELFSKTLMFFAGLTGIVLIIYLSGIFKGII